MTLDCSCPWQKQLSVLPGGSPELQMAIIHSANTMFGTQLMISRNTRTLDNKKQQKQPTGEISTGVQTLPFSDSDLCSSRSKEKRCSSLQVLQTKMKQIKILELKNHAKISNLLDSSI